MRKKQSILGAVRCAVFAVALWTLCATALLAQARSPGGPSSAESSSAWVMAYMMVIMIIALGMIVVCKSSGRRDRAKPEVYGEAKTLPKE
jgi:hypothetical protein